MSAPNIGQKWSRLSEILKIDFTDLNSKGIHHLGIVVPKQHSFSELNSLCEKLVDFKEQQLLMGYVSLSDSSYLELLRPYADVGPLAKYLNIDYFTLDHFCFHARIEKKFKYTIGSRFYSPLWEKECRFFLTDDLIKTEIIYASSCI